MKDLTKKVRLNVVLTTDEKERFEKWCREVGYHSESDAIRSYIREVTGWSPMMAAEGKSVRIEEKEETS